jgi:hypothetical protein
MTMHTSKQTAAFQVLDGEVCAGIDPQVVLVEAADGQLDVLRTDELSGWYGLGVDGVVRALRHGPTRQLRHQREPLRRARTSIRGQRTLCTLHGQTT